MEISLYFWKRFSFPKMYLSKTKMQMAFKNPMLCNNIGVILKIILLYFCHVIIAVVLLPLHVFAKF